MNSEIWKQELRRVRGQPPPPWSESGICRTFERPAGSHRPRTNTGVIPLFLLERRNLRPRWTKRFTLGDTIAGSKWQPHHSLSVPTPVSYPHTILARSCASRRKLEEAEQPWWLYCQKSGLKSCSSCTLGKPLVLSKLRVSICEMSLIMGWEI